MASIYNNSRRAAVAMLLAIVCSVVGISSGLSEDRAVVRIDVLPGPDDRSVRAVSHSEMPSSPQSVIEPIDLIVDLFETPYPLLVGTVECLTGGDHFHFETSLSEEAIGIQPIPPRPGLLLEYNEQFLSTGDLGWSWTAPTGAVWRPSVWVFGEHRVGVSHRDQSASRIAPTQRFTEVAQRLDVFAQLNLSGTERFLIGLRPLDEEVRGPGGSLRREFNAYDFRDGDSIDGWNDDIQTLFFEGDFGELFPTLDLYDHAQNDYGFSIGRQPLLAQQGLLIAEDMLDAVTLTRNTLSGNGVLNARWTAVYAWNRVSRHDLGALATIADRNSQLIALMAETDFAESTVNADVVYVDAHNDIGSMVVWGLSDIRRIHTDYHTWNSSLHVLASHPTHGETSQAGQGELLFARTSWTPHGGLDLIYLNSFWGIDQFTSAARGPLQGGPLGGSLGILFAHTGLGQASNPLSTQVSNAAGASLGYQIQLNDLRRQIILEVGGRGDTEGRRRNAIAGAVRYQHAIGQHWIGILDGFAGKPDGDRVFEGIRMELLTRF